MLLVNAIVVIRRVGQRNDCVVLHVFRDNAIVLWALLNSSDLLFLLLDSVVFFVLLHSWSVATAILLKWWHVNLLHKCSRDVLKNETVPILIFFFIILSWSVRSVDVCLVTSVVDQLDRLSAL